MSEVGALHLEKRPVALLALDLEQFIIVGIEAELATGDDVAGKRLCLAPLFTFETHLGGKKLGCVCRDRAEMFHLVGSLTLAVVEVDKELLVV